MSSSNVDPTAAGELHLSLRIRRAYALLRGLIRINRQLERELLSQIEAAARAHEEEAAEGRRAATN